MKIPKGDQLKKESIDMGISQHQLYSSTSGIIDEPELQRRWIEAKRSERESRLWFVALLSAIASIFSAIVAWVAVSCKQ